jgi:hypothetical protein
MPLSRAMRIIEKAREEETKEYYYRWWLVRYPYYKESDYESFDEFYDKARPKRIIIDTRSKEEIMNEIAEIEEKFEERG